MNFELFLETLPIMAKGMGGIFIVTAVLIGLTYILNRLSSGKAKDNAE